MFTNPFTTISAINVTKVVTTNSDARTEFVWERQGVSEQHSHITLLEHSILINNIIYSIQILSPLYCRPLFQLEPDVISISSIYTACSYGSAIESLTLGELQ
jgi:hypothetical protein